MFNKKVMLLTAMLFFTSFCVFGQDIDTVNVEEEEEVEEVNPVWDYDWKDDPAYNWGNEFYNKWKNDWSDDVNWNFNFIEFHGRPAISLNYGISEISMNDFASSFGKPNLIESRLGYMSEKSEWENIGRYKYSYLRLGDYSTQLSNKDFSSSELQSNMWRFGAGWESGYDYKFGESAIIPSYTFALDWSRLEIKSFAPAVTPEEEDILKRYNEAFRFGTSTEAGLKFRTIAGITLEAAYERSIIFERHLFWKWAGSTIIEVASQGLLDAFIGKVMDSSPYAAPIVNFVLKNALSYGLYELRQEKMNWPFPSAAPLAYDHFKIGMTFLF